MKYVNLVIVFQIFLPFLFVNADRGMIPVNPNAQIFEPNQRAMIAWNGDVEILLLSTDLHASDSTMLLEVLPLPSEPDVKKGELETFRKATDLINKKLYSGQMAKGRQLSEGVVVPSGEVTFHKRIGAHDISVTHLLDAQGFVDWVVNYLKTLGIEKNIISEEMKRLIEDYVADGYEWYVFDVVSVGKETVTNEPIQYRFKSKDVFYPLKITNTAQGSTSIELLILTPRLLSRFPDLSIESIHLKHEPISIALDELKALDDDMYEMLKNYQKLRLRIWQLEGELGSFSHDLIAH
jgi:hypothetical protein